MDPLALSGPLREQLLEFAWDEWAQMGLLAHTDRVSQWAQDPEALILLTLEVARADPRLFDELLDWTLTNEQLLSVRRLRALSVDDSDRALAAATVGWVARQRPRERPRRHGDPAAPGELEALFDQAGRVVSPDEDFAAAGLARPELTRSGNSQAPDPSAAINLAFRLRQILGVGIRAEVMRILLCIDAPWAGTQALARSAGYSKRNVHEALTGLANARVITQHTVSGEQRYSPERPAWATLLGVAPNELPSHRDWPQLLGALRIILRFLTQAELAQLSDYMRASRTRELLERVRPMLAFAGVPVSLGPGPPEAAWGELEAVLASTMGMIRQGPGARSSKPAHSG